MPVARYAELAPAAFRPSTDADRAFVATVGKNWVASDAPVGVAVDRVAHQGTQKPLMPAVSAGSTAHPSTTYAATADVFAFLDAATADYVSAADRARPKCGGGDDGFGAVTARAAAAALAAVAGLGGDLAPLEAAAFALGHVSASM
jgi:hypothetical protein